MRKIITKYSGECRRCEAEIDPGDSAYHERRVGLFCIGCQPTDGSDELRQYRQEALDARSERIAERATRKSATAAGIRARDQHLVGDIAYATQPGHIPGRRRVIERRERAAVLDAEAETLARQAKPRRACVKGDAASRDEARRESVRQWIAPGMRVRHSLLGAATVEKVNRKTARLRIDSSGNSYAEDLIFIHQLEGAA